MHCVAVVRAFNTSNEHLLLDYPAGVHPCSAFVAAGIVLKNGYHIKT